MRLLPILMFALSLALSACNGEGDAPPPQTGPARTSDWRTVHGNPAVAVPEGEDDRELHEAMRQARATADQARERWMYEPPELQRRWSIKWAAPKAEGGVEHIWVQPQHWSAFRIEGVLLSRPIAPLACGKTQGDAVSFPIEELSDWLRLSSDDPPGGGGGPYEGGYTVKVLEKHHGRPDS